jgi:hypothetical protein
MANNVQPLLENISDIEEKIRKLQARVLVEVENAHSNHSVVPSQFVSSPRQSFHHQQHFSNANAGVITGGHSNRSSEKRGESRWNRDNALPEQQHHQLSPIHTANTATASDNLLLPRARQFNLVSPNEGFSLLTAAHHSTAERAAETNSTNPLLSAPPSHASIILSNPNAGIVTPLTEPHLLTSEIKKVCSRSCFLLPFFFED